jgi:lipoprotein-anchoring transpeptidase ErfK/SrfK
VRLACVTAGTVAAGTAFIAPALAAPPASGSSIPGMPISLPGGPAPLAQPNFSPPAINPAAGETVGVAQPVIITFNEPVTDHAAAESAIRITSSTVVPGHFYWFGNKQVRWRPDQFWPANTDVTVEAGASKVNYHVGDAFVAMADDTTHQITITRNGEVVKTMPTSMGKPGHETPNGTYYVGERLRKMIMDSSTYGVPATAAGGYKLEVQYATRIANDGIFIHAAPWSVGQQGHTDVSHGCLNVSTDNAKWYLENAHKGDPVIVKNTKGGILNGHDGYGDWNLGG